jgi:hypothetical protein
MTLIFSRRYMFERQWNRATAASRTSSAREVDLTVDNLEATLSSQLPPGSYLLRCKASNPWLLRNFGRTCGFFNELERPPVYTIFPPTSQQPNNRSPVGLLHAIPGLPLPEESVDESRRTYWSIREFLKACQGDSRELSWGQAIATNEFGVGVLVLGHEQASHFVVRFRPQMPMEFLSEPVQLFNDSLITSRNGPSAAHQSPSSRESIVKEFFHLAWRSASDCLAFQQCSTWWYRLDETAKLLIANDPHMIPQRDAAAASSYSGGSPEALFNRGDETAGESNASLLNPRDVRWAMLPAHKLLQNKKWNEKPDYLAKEMKYGLLELFSPSGSTGL